MNEAYGTGPSASASGHDAPDREQHESPFAAIRMSPPDPILGVNEAFRADRSSRKVNLSLGVYCDETGQLPLLDSVRKAEARLLRSRSAHPYLPIDGLPAFTAAIPPLLFGAGSKPASEGRAVTVQTVGSTGALRIGAEFLKRILSGVKVWISNPSWANHRAVFEAAGFEVATYPYYDPETSDLSWPALIERIGSIPPGDVVLFHGCCHNPTGVDPQPEQWAQIATVVRARRLIPFIDLSYQGFADGLDADRSAIDRFVAIPGPLLVANSFSKSLSLYGERVGALTTVTAAPGEAERVRSLLKTLIRAAYSSPPGHGASVAASVLGDPELRRLWETELDGVRRRVRDMRAGLRERLTELLPGHDFTFVTRQRGLFSYLPLTRTAIQALRHEFSIHAVDGGRICVAALNGTNLDYVAHAIARAAGRA